MLLQCLQEYLEAEEQWLFYLLAEKTGTTQVSIITLWHQPMISLQFKMISRVTVLAKRQEQFSMIFNLGPFVDIFPKI